MTSTDFSNLFRFFSHPAVFPSWDGSKPLREPRRTAVCDEGTLVKLTINHRNKDCLFLLHNQKMTGQVFTHIAFSSGPKLCIGWLISYNKGNDSSEADNSSIKSEMATDTGGGRSGSKDMIQRVENCLDSLIESHPCYSYDCTWWNRYARVSRKEDDIPFMIE